MNPIVWVIGRNHWPRALLAAELLERGYEAYGFPDMAGALLALVHAERPALAIIDLSGIDADPADLRRFLERGTRLLGIADALSSRGALAAELPWARLLHRPCSIGEIADSVTGLL